MLKQLVRSLSMVLLSLIARHVAVTARPSRANQPILLSNFTSTSMRKIVVTKELLQGGRRYMEDTHVVSKDGSFVGVFDGHGGDSVAKYIEGSVYAYFLAELIGDKSDWTPEMVMRSFTNCLSRIDNEASSIRKWAHIGSTGVLTFVKFKDCIAGMTFAIITANVGDSRSVLSRGFSAVDLTVDHKPENRKERQRIEALGGSIKWHGLFRRGRPVEGTGVYRINGNLALSRAIGDAAEKPYVCCEPDVSCVEGSSTDEFIITASDGLWDAFTSQEAVDFVHAQLAQWQQALPSQQDKSLELNAHPRSQCGTHMNAASNRKARLHLCRSNIPKLLAAEAIRRGSADNITIVIQWLKES